MHEFDMELEGPAGKKSGGLRILALWYLTAQKYTEHTSHVDDVLCVIIMIKWVYNCVVYSKV